MRLHELHAQGHPLQRRHGASPRGMVRRHLGGPMMFEEVFEEAGNRDDDVAYLLCGSPGKGDGPPGRLPRGSVGWMLISGALRMPYRAARVGQDEKQGLVEGKNLYRCALARRSVSNTGFASFLATHDHGRRSGPHGGCQNSGHGRFRPARGSDPASRRSSSRSPSTRTADNPSERADYGAYPE